MHSLVLFFFIFSKVYTSQEEIDYSPNNPVENTLATGSIIPTQPVQSNNTLQQQVLETQKNQFSWQEVSPSHTIKIPNNRFNWYRRKILSEKTFGIYNNILAVINSIIKSINLFKEKTAEVTQLKNDFSENTKIKLIQFNQSFLSFNDVSNFITVLENKFATYKEAHLYINNKNFRKKIDHEVQSFSNLKSMLQNIIENTAIFDTAYITFLNSVNNLEQLKEDAKKEEEIAWNKYQQLDELINDQNAHKNFLEVTNIFDNLSNNNAYIRSTFLQFFNESLLNLSNGSEHILNLTDNLLKNITELERKMATFFSEIEQEEINIKQKFLQEQQEKLLAEERLKAIEAQKKIAAEREKNKLSWYNSLFLRIKKYGNELSSIVTSHLNHLVNKAINYYNLLFKKEHISASIKKHAPVIAKNQSTTVSQNISGLTVNTNNAVETILTPPQLNTPEEQIEPSVLTPEAPLSAPETSEDIFSKQKQTIIPKEHKKRGSASYPAAPVISSQFSGNQPDQQQFPSFDPSAGVAASEEIGTPEQTNIENQKDQLSEEKFAYKALDTQGQETRELINPLVDLSGITKDIGVGNRAYLGISTDSIEAVEGGPESQDNRNSRSRERTNNTESKRNLEKSNKKVIKNKKKKTKKKKNK